VDRLVGGSGDHLAAVRPSETHNQTNPEGSSKNDDHNGQVGRRGGGLSPERSRPVSRSDLYRSQGQFVSATAPERRFPDDQEVDQWIEDHFLDESDMTASPVHDQMTAATARYPYLNF
jgi:hypothetical protein